MKVMQINCVYRKGSTGKIVYDLHTEYLRKGIDSVVCYGRGEKHDDAIKVCSELYAKANNLRSRLTGLMYGGCYLSTRKLIRVIKAQKPDIVHLHCINGYFVNIYRLIHWLKKSGIRTVLTLHAELMHTANCGHAYECEKWKSGCKGCDRYKKETKSIFFNRTHTSWKKMKTAFEGFEKLSIVSVSPWLMERAKQSPILKAYHHTTVLNGIDTQIFTPCVDADLRADGKKLVFYATATFLNDPSHAKGGHYVLKLAERMKDVQFLIAAATYDSSIRWPENVRFLGSISDQKRLAQCYSSADLCLVVSKRETFSMPVAESLCCGTPVVGFEAGAPETIALQEFSSFVPYGDLAALEAAVRDALQKGKAASIAQRAKEKYAKTSMADGYLSVYQQLMEKSR